LIHSIEWGKMRGKASLPEILGELGNVTESFSHLKSEDENDSIVLTSIINTLTRLSE